VFVVVFDPPGVDFDPGTVAELKGGLGAFQPGSGFAALTAKEMLAGAARDVSTLLTSVVKNWAGYFWSGDDELFKV